MNDWYDLHRLGAIAEARATAWLIEQGWRVFQVICDEDGKKKMVDVKMRPFIGPNKGVARATVSKRQRELGVEILHVLHDGAIRWEADL